MATATQDDDLLIITDESDDSSSGMDFTFDFGDESSSDSTSTQEVLKTVEETPQTLEVQEETSQENLSTLDISDSKEEVIDFSLDSLVSEDPQTENISESSVIDVQNTPSSDSVEFGLDFGNTEIAEENKEVVQETPQETPQETAVKTSETISSNEESLNDILSATIIKLESRKESIAQDKAAKTSKEEELKLKIKELQDEVKELESDMKILDSESEKITLNITELEKMKLDPVKEHNARRVVKK